MRIGRLQERLDAPEWALEFLKKGRVARLGTADREGRPLVVPICYVFDGQRLYSAIDAKPKRTRRLKRLADIAQNPNVSLLVDHYEEDWRTLRYVIVKGQAEVLVGRSEYLAAIDDLAAKYPQYKKLPLEYKGSSVIRVIPKRVICWKYGEE